MSRVVILSGGLDSTVLLAHLTAMDDEPVEALSIDYGQRHRRELDAAQAVATQYGVPWTCVDLRGLRTCLGGSSQTDDTVPVPHGHYAADTMRVTVVPNRNMILLAVAGGFALARGAAELAYAAHAGDHAIYPDCRPAFAEAMSAALGVADWRPLQLLTPFIAWTKAEIVRCGATLGVPFGLTYSCYEGAEVHCGRCGTCVERREAFQLAGVADPTIYRP